MPLYELRLYKTEPGSLEHKLVDRVLFEANDNGQAIATAPSIEASLYDDCDLGLLFDNDQKRLWILKP